MQSLKVLGPIRLLNKWTCFTTEVPWIIISKFQVKKFIFPAALFYFQIEVDFYDATEIQIQEDWTPIE